MVCGDYRDRLFDGFDMHSNCGVIIEATRIVIVGPTLAATYFITKYRRWNGQASEPAALQQRRSYFKSAIDEGVTIIAGGNINVFEQGKNVEELKLMVNHRVSAKDVLKSATSTNATVF